MLNPFPFKWSHVTLPTFGSFRNHTVINNLNPLEMRHSVLQCNHFVLRFFESPWACIQTNIDAWYYSAVFWLKELAWPICVTVVDFGEPRYPEWNIWPPERMISMNMKCDFWFGPIFPCNSSSSRGACKKNMYEMPEWWTVGWMKKETIFIMYYVCCSQYFPAIYCAWLTTRNRACRLFSIVIPWSLVDELVVVSHFLSGRSIHYSTHFHFLCFLLSRINARNIMLFINTQSRLTSFVLTMSLDHWS